MTLLIPGVNENYLFKKKNQQYFTVKVVSCWIYSNADLHCKYFVVYTFYFQNNFYNILDWKLDFLLSNL